MRPTTFGEILEVDELLNHQLPQPFSQTGPNDLGWTEKIWSTFAKKDGTLQADLGVGKYQNRNIIDAFAGVIGGHTQRTVRVSREIDPNMQFQAGAGKASNDPGLKPITYEVVEPLKRVNFRLDANDIQPISFDLEFQAEMPCFFEDKQFIVNNHTMRTTSDVIRYHQMGTVKGWIEVDGTRHEVKPDEWFAARDHSWGVRPSVGAQPHDVQPRKPFGDGTFLMHWSPILLTRPDGTKYSFQYFLMKDRTDTYHFSGYLNHMDGRQERVGRVRPEIKYDDTIRQPISGKIHFDMMNGETRTVEIETQENGAGFHLGAGLYSPIDGHHHGSWRGEFHTEGDCHDDVQNHDTMRKIRQLRDGVISAREGDAEGYGIFESIMIGDWPEYGLRPDRSFR